MTLIDTATGWLEIVEIPNKNSQTLATLLVRVWLSRYPLPQKLIVDNGTEFKREFYDELTKFGIKPKITTVKTPQANGVLERVHQTVGNMLRTKQFDMLPKTKSGQWDDILASVAWAVRSTTHMVLGSTPGQIVYGRDMLFPLKYVAEWDVLQKRREHSVETANVKENKSRVEYDYKVGDKILLEDKEIQRKMNCPTKGLFIVKTVHANGNLTISRGIFTERVNIRRCTPYHSKKF